MKKIILLIVLGLGLTTSVNAQDTNKSQVKDVLSVAKSAEKDAAEVALFLGFDETKKEDFKRLFVMKYEIMQNKNTTLEKKKEFSRIVAAKIAASIDSNQLEKLKANEVLYKQLISEDLLK